MATTSSELRSLSATAASGSTGSIGLARQENHVLLFRVTALVPGAGDTLTMAFQDSMDNTNFTEVSSLAVTGTGSYRIELPNSIGRYGRASWTIAGGGTWTFEIHHGSDPVS